jgi:hypothetical protein
MKIHVTRCPKRGQRDSIEAWLCSKANRQPFCMSAFGTKRTSSYRQSMSAFGGKADISIAELHVCF